MSAKVFSVCSMRGLREKCVCRMFHGRTSSGKLPGGLEHNAVVKHFYLNLSAFDVVGAMATDIHVHLLHRKCGIVAAGYKDALFAPKNKTHSSSYLRHIFLASFRIQSTTTGGEITLTPAP